MSMTLQEKITLMQAYERGEEIESRLVNDEGITYIPESYEWRPAGKNTLDGIPKFNFFNFEYRIKPKYIGQRIRDLVKKFNLHEIDVQALAFLYRSGKLGGYTCKPTHWTMIRKDGSLGDVIMQNQISNGDVNFGCQFFKWEEIDAYAKEEGWWK